MFRLSVVCSTAVQKFPTAFSDSRRDPGRPRVLLADDDAGISRAISRTLAADFEVVATVTSGHETLDTVANLDPDVVVLDIAMPGLNGFETAEELKRSGSRSRIVFLTMHQDDTFVAKAIGCGAAGYVTKMLAWSDLVPALHHALAGRQYLPSLRPLVMTDSDTHAVQFRGSDGSWLEGAADMLSSALQRGDTIATVLLESNRDALAPLMKERRWNLAALREQGRYLVFDAEEAATQVMRGGCPDVDTLTGLVEMLESARTASGDRARSHLTIVGEIATVLWRNGNPDAALEVERIWDELTRSLPILTICAYPMDYLGHDAMAAFSSDICAHHSVVSRAVQA